MQNQQLLPVLEKIGLTRIEAQVYLALLERGVQPAGVITKNTGIHRRTVYDAIARLIEKGLVSYIQSNNIKLYQATHPERLQELVKEQEEALQNHMKQLEGMYGLQPARHETLFYRGKKGLKALFDDQLKKEGETILYLGATPVAVEQLQFYFPHFDRQRMKKRIKVKLLFDQRAEKQAYIKKIPLAESRILRTTEQRDVVTCIYGDTISIISFSDKPFGLLIHESAIADQYRNYFELLWKMGKKK